MMTQRRLPFQYQIENSGSGLTSFAGLPLYMDFAVVSGLCDKITETLKTKTQGWSDLQIIMSLILLNLAGGDCVEDIERLEADEGLRTLLLKTQTYGMTRKERRAFGRRFRKSKDRAFPSASAIRRYLEQFHNAKEEHLREGNKAFIPEANDTLKRLVEVNKTLVDFAQEKNPIKIATLDQDATLVATSKREALYSYKKFQAYQPFNTYWHEQGILLHSEFRDGNVNAGYGQLRLLEESLDSLPNNIEHVLLRSDSAGYQQDLLKYCAEGANKRFGVIEFAIAAKVTGAFKTAALETKESAWMPIYKTGKNGEQIKTTQECAEICFVPNFVAALSKNSNATYRYIAIRERLSVQMEIPGLESPAQAELPFPTLEMNSAEYKLFGIVTNRSLSANELVNWHRERCGDSEKVHCVEKADLAGGQFPSGKFGANAAWWAIMVMAFNLSALMKKLAMPETLSTKRLKGVRFHVINVAGRLVQHARGLYIKLSGGLSTLRLFQRIQEAINALGNSPPQMPSTA